MASDESTSPPDPKAPKSHQPRSEVRDGMHIDWDVPITMDDGLVLRADVFRPVKPGKYPVILSYGPYAKGLAFQEGYPSAWQRMVDKHPDVAAGSSNKYQNWEVVDPEKWVPHDYACVRVDSRGCGCSPGVIDHFSPRETKDFYDCIEWAGTQPWSNGKVGLNGISYYGINQWHVASLQPPHLAAMCIWEGAADWFRDMTRHGGILSTFWKNWYDMQVKTVQYGAGERGRRSPVHGELVCGPETLSEEELAKNRADLGGEILAHPLDDAFHRARSAVWSKIKVPLFSAANWGGQGLASARQFRGICAGGIEGEMARGPRHRALDPFLHRLRARAAAALLRPFPARQGVGLGQAAQGAAAGPPSRRKIRRPRRERMAARAHKVDEIPSPSRRRHAARDPRRRQGDAELCRDGRRPHLHDGADDRADRDHRPDRGEAFCFIVDQRRRPVPDRAGVLAGPQGGGVPGRDRSPHADRTGLAARLAPQARQEAHPALPPLSHPRQEAAAQGRRGGRARHRDLADLHRRAARLPRRADDPRQGLRIWRRRAAAVCRTSRTS